VIDADTIKVKVAGKVESVRLVGIEAPEVRRTEKAKRQAHEHGLTLEELLAKGEAATAKLRQMVEGRRGSRTPFSLPRSSGYSGG